MTDAPNDKKVRFHFLDGLRGIAATMIVLLHSTGGSFSQLAARIHMPWLGSGYENLLQSGVVLFFVLSGVVLLRPYLRGERRFRTGNYFVRRFKRLYPPYFFALLFAAFVAYFNNHFSTWYNENGFRMAFSWHEVFKELFIVDLKNGQYYNLAWWSLGVEVVFYLLVPVIILLFPRKSLGNHLRMWVLLTVTFAGSIALQLFLDKHYPAIYSNEHIVVNVFRFIEYPVCFLLGMFLAARDFSTKDGSVFMVPGALLVVGSLWYLPLMQPGFGFIYAAIIIFSFNKASFRHFLSKPIMVWMGERSYSLFLIHFSVFYLVDNITSHFVTSRNTAYLLLTRGIGLPLSLLAAMLLFTFVEKRFARGLITADAFWPWQVKPIE